MQTKLSNNKKLMKLFQYFVVRCHRRTRETTRQKNEVIKKHFDDNTNESNPPSPKMTAANQSNHYSNPSHDKIVQFKMLLSSDPVNWEEFLCLDKDLNVLLMPSLKVSFSWILARHPPNDILKELLIRYENYFIPNSIHNKMNSSNSNRKNNIGKGIKCALKYRNVEFLRFIASGKERALLRQSIQLGALHHASDVEIASVLLQAYPESIYLQNKDGDLPIHVAMKKFRNVDHIKLLMEYYHLEGYGGVFVKNRNGQSPFSILCKQIETGIDATNLTIPFYSADLRLWDKLNLVLQKRYFNDYANTYGSSSTMNSSTLFQILHELISFNCPYQAILMALILKPDKLYQTDASGRLPLSLCVEQTSYQKSTLLKVIKSFPDAVHIPDNHGRICLHWAALSGRKLEDGTLDLLNLYPDGLHLEDKEGMLPFMLAAASDKSNNDDNENDSKSLDIIYHLLREGPEYFSRSIYK